MKICILTERMRLGFGVDLVVNEQASRLVTLGFEVVVVAIHADIVQPKRDYKLIVINKILRVGDFGTEAWMRHILSSCKIKDVDLWILHTPPFYDWLKFLDGPVVLVEHGAPPGKYFPPGLGNQIDAMSSSRLNQLYNLLQPYDAIQSISRSIHGWLPLAVQSSSSVIHHGCDHYPLVPHIDALELRSQLGASEDDCLILWVGRMQLENDEQPYKGFHELLNLMPLVRRHVDNVKFVLAGKVSDKDLKSLQNMGITVLPNLKAEELARAYAASDVLINLSQWEGFNLALLEAQYQGVPVVAYDFGPHCEIVRHAETGLLAKTPSDFLQSVILIARDEPLRKRLAAEAAAFAHDFTWDRSVAKLVEQIDGCLSRTPSRIDIIADRDKAASAQVASPEYKQGMETAASAAEILELEGRAFVRAARASLFGSGPDPVAEASLLHQLSRGVDRRNLLAELAASEKAQALDRRIPGLDKVLVELRDFTPTRNGGLASEPLKSSLWLDLDDDLFVKHTFRVLLGREAEPEAVAGRVGQLRNGHSRRYVLEAVRFSEEGKNRLLEDPDIARLLQPEVAAPAVELQAEPLPPPVAVEKIARTEKVRPARRSLSEWKRFQQTIYNLFFIGLPPPFSHWFLIDNEDFVRDAFRVLLGREAEPEAIAGRVHQLRNGYSRRAILAAIRFSEEGKRRPLHDPHLRRILAGEKLRRLLPIAWMRGGQDPIELEPEDRNRQIRRIDSQIRSLSAEIGTFKHSIAAVAQTVQSLEHKSEQVLREIQTPEAIVSRLVAIDARLASLDAKLSDWQDRATNISKTDHQRSLPVKTSFATSLSPLRLGPHHVALLAPGAILEPDALTQLSRAVLQGLDSDIVFGDECERLDQAPFLRQRVHGPFAHDTFLCRPDLGGVVAVHDHLLERMNWLSTVALTGEVLLRLVAQAHSLTYLPINLCERDQKAIVGNRPVIDDMKSYANGIGRSTIVTQDGAAGFDVRFPVSDEWKAAIIAFVNDDTDMTPWLKKLKDNMEARRSRLILVRAPDTVPSNHFSNGLSAQQGNRFGALVNGAVRDAPEDCNLIFLLGGGVSPTSPDWLERLAEVALRPDTGAVAPKIVDPSGRRLQAGLSLGLTQPYNTVSRFAFAGDFDRAIQDADPLSFDTVRDVPAISCDAMMFRRSVFIDQGQFDEMLGVEAVDLDFCCRLRRASLSVLCNGRATMVQHGRAPQWVRHVPEEDLQELLRRHQRLLDEATHVQNTAHRSATGELATLESTFTVHLPPLAYR